MSAPDEKADNSAAGGKRRKKRFGTPFKPGQSGNPGGAPKGKRISTWMAELGQMTRTQLKKAERGLPINGQIALARIRAAMSVGSKQGNGATEIILDRTEGKVPQTLQNPDGGALTVQIVNYAAPGKNGEKPGGK